MRRRRKSSKEERICPICSLSFNKAEHLERHLRSHTKEKPFRCQVCDKVFARQDTLLRHSRSHQTDYQKTGARSQNYCVDERPDPGNVPGPASSAEATEGSVVSIPLLEVPPQPPSVDQETRTIYNNHLQVNMLTGLDISESNMIGDPGVAPTAVPSLDDPSDQQADIIPQWTLETDPNTQWMDLFAGDSFDIDLLNLLLPFPTPDPNQTMMEISARTPISNLLPKPQATIQSKWHTWTANQDTSGDTTTYSSQGRYHIDEACHQSITDRLLPRSQEGPIPSIEFLNLCIQAYFTNFHPVFPIIHAPSFRPSSQNSLLLLSTCSVGSLFLGSSRALSRGISIFERLNKHMLSSWESLISNPETSNVVALQASVIGQMFGLLVGRPKDLMQIELFHGCSVAWARQLRLFDIKEPKINVAELSGPTLDQAWREFITIEEKKRVALCILLQDAEVGSLFHHDPLVHQCISQLPSTSSNEAFAAPNASTWKEAMLHQEAQRVIVSPRTPDMGAMSLSLFSEISSDFGLYVMLERIGTLACGNQMKSPNWPETARRCKDLLMSWYLKYRESAMYKRNAASLMILWHSVFMLIYMDIDVLECFSGREGPAIAEMHQESAQGWARSADARRCIIHSVLVQRHFEHIPLGAEPPIYAPQCLYRCGIAWFCYTSFGGETCTETEGDLVYLDLPELEILGVNGTSLFIEEVVPRYGRLMAGPLFRITDLLQRISHWKIAHNLASTLLLLVEGQSIL
ncbi:hypothetical protein DL98DRAFT_438461 [Cadophora sp. DSE1049]|nr:hypothetical protein DL98DRAFT_438461 [Cadophora sp. DSE1049]